MVCTGCARCENFKQDFVARTFALIAPVRPILHRVSCSNETIPNAPKWYEKHQNMRLGSIAVGWERSLRKIPTRLLGTYFCINYKISACFAYTIVPQRNGLKYSQTVHQYMSLEQIGEDQLCSFGKITMRLHGTKVCINCPSSAVLHRLFWCNKTVPNTPKWYKTHQNMSLGSNGVDRVRSLPKILLRLHGMNFCISCTSSARSAPSFVQ